MTTVDKKLVEEFGERNRIERHNETITTIIEDMSKDIVIEIKPEYSVDDDSCVEVYSSEKHFVVCVNNSEHSVFQLIECDSEVNPYDVAFNIANGEQVRIDGGVEMNSPLNNNF